MIVNDYELSIMFDVDQTLILWDQPKNSKNIGITRVETGRINKVTPHTEHIELLKQHHYRGYHVTVWSASGTTWALAVVDALGLTGYVDEVRTKPLKFVDDLQADEVLGTRIYIPFKE